MCPARKEVEEIAGTGVGKRAFDYWVFILLFIQDVCIFICMRVFSARTVKMFFSKELVREMSFRGTHEHVSEFEERANWQPIFQGQE